MAVYCRLNKRLFALIIYLLTIILTFQVFIVVNHLIYFTNLLSQSQHNSTFSNIIAINRTPNYRFFDDKLLSYHNNVHLEQYRLHYCNIDKNMGSATQAILCYIDDQNKHGDLFENQTWNAGLEGSECGYSTAIGELRRRFLKAAENLLYFDKSSGIYHFAIVRHPLERFISSFLFVCGPPKKVDRRPPPLAKNRQSAINYRSMPPWKRENLKLWDKSDFASNDRCYKCGLDLACFLPKLHRDFLRHSQHLYADRWFMDWHFFPQSWYCDFDRQLSQYHLLRYGRNEQFWTQLTDMFDTVGIDSQLIASIASKLRNTNVTHATFDRRDQIYRQLSENAQLVDYIYKIYYLDYRWFDYQLDTV